MSIWFSQPRTWVDGSAILKEKIIRETKDEHLHEIIYDYYSPDIDLKQAPQRSTLQNYKYITKPGKYSRVESFTEAIQSILDPETIFVIIDLHLDIGSQMVNDVRTVDRWAHWITQLPASTLEEYSPLAHTLLDATGGFLEKWRLRNEQRNSILMTYSTQFCVELLIGWKFASSNQRPQICVVKDHQYGISTFVS